MYRQLNRKYDFLKNNYYMVQSQECLKNFLLPKPSLRHGKISATERKLNRREACCGDNQLEIISNELRTSGRRVLLVYTRGSIKKNGSYDQVPRESEEVGMELFALSGVDPNPRHTSVNMGPT